jgi:hypothetical protein
MVVVLGLDDHKRDADLEEKNVIGAQDGLFVAGGVAATNDNAPWAQRVLPVYLFDGVPARLLDCWCDELFANVGF